MQLESFISFIRQANTYGESENWAVCCSCVVRCWEVLYEAGADIGPVIKELQSSRKEKSPPPSIRRKVLTSAGEEHSR